MTPMIVITIRVFPLYPRECLVSKNSSSQVLHGSLIHDESEKENHYHVKEAPLSAFPSAGVPPHAASPPLPAGAASQAEGSAFVCPQSPTAAAGPWFQSFPAAAEASLLDLVVGAFVVDLLL